MDKLNINQGTVFKILKYVLILALVWFFRPLFHSLFMSVYINPIMIEVVVVWFLIHRFLIRPKESAKKQIEDEDELESGYYDSIYAVKTVGSFIILFILVVAAGVFSHIMPQVHLVNELEYNNIDTLPETRENIRLMPYEVAERFSKDSLQLSQFKLGKENIAVVNDSLAWTFPLEPDGTVLKFLIKNYGMIHIDATTQSRVSELTKKDLEIGEGMLIFDNLWWNVYKDSYNVDYDRTYYIPHNGEVYTVASFTDYDFENKFGLFYTVPRFGGVMLIDSDGNIERLSPEEAANHPVLEGNRLFPEDLARYYGEAYKYNEGVINRFFIHEDQIKIRDVPGPTQANKQPFLMDTEDGLKWFISAEPAGESRGIFKIFLFDAETGDIELFELPVEDTLTGPTRATDFVRRDNPTVDWNRFKMVEPLPFIRDDVLFWKVVVIPGDAAGIAYQAFLDTRTNEVTRISTDEGVAKFIRTGDVDEEPIIIDRAATIEEIKAKLVELQELIEKLEEEESS